MPTWQFEASKHAAYTYCTAFNSSNACLFSNGGYIHLVAASIWWVLLPDIVPWLACLGFLICYAFSGNYTKIALVKQDFSTTVRHRATIVYDIGTFLLMISAR
jgi:hypothetical protein